LLLISQINADKNQKRKIAEALAVVDGKEPSESQEKATSAFICADLRRKS
jgi:hypothetical protein